MKKLIIVGAGGCGREVLAIAKDLCQKGCSDWEPYGFLGRGDEDLVKYGCDLPVLGSVENWRPRSGEVFALAVGSPETRKRLYSALMEKGAAFVTLIHPTCVVAAGAKIGSAVTIYPMSVVSVGTQVNDGAMINLHCSVGHDAVVGAFSVLSSYCDLTGGVVVGEEAFLGSHVTTAPGVKIGSRAKVGIGSVVVTNVRQGAKVFGNPARPLQL